MARSIPVRYYRRVNPVDPRMATTPARLEAIVSALSRPTLAQAAGIFARGQRR